MIYNGVTRATRVAGLLPGRIVQVEVMRTIVKSVGHLPVLGDTLPLLSRELKRDIIGTLSELIEHTLDIRFGQLIANLSVIARGSTPEAVWDMEDDELLEAMKSHIKDFARSHVESA